VTSFRAPFNLVESWLFVRYAPVLYVKLKMYMYISNLTACFVLDCDIFSITQPLVFMQHLEKFYESGQTKANSNCLI